SPTPATRTWQSHNFAGSILCHEAITTSWSSSRLGVGSARQGLKTPSSREKSHPAAMPRAPAPSARRNSRRFMERFMERWLDDPARFRGKNGVQRNAPDSVSDGDLIWNQYGGLTTTNCDPWG